MRRASSKKNCFFPSTDRATRSLALPHPNPTRRPFGTRIGSPHKGALRNPTNGCLMSTTTPSHTSGPYVRLLVSAQRILQPHSEEASQSQATRCATCASLYRREPQAPSSTGSRIQMAVTPATSSSRSPRKRRTRSWAFCPLTRRTCRRVGAAACYNI